MARSFGDGSRIQCERRGIVIKRSKRQEQAPLYWRPDFRDREQLPDIKTIRTGFFLSALAATLAAMTLIFVGIREYKIMNLKGNIEEIQKEIDVYRVENALIVNKNKAFRENILKIQEIVAFVDEKAVSSDLIMDVAGALSGGMVFRKFEYKEATARFEGTIPSKVDSDNALNGFIENLKAIESLNTRFKKFNQTSVVRQKESGDVDFIVDMNNEDAKKKNRRRR